MDKHTTSSSLPSSPTWEGLHEWLRDRIQELIQELLEDEATELLGRVRCLCGAPGRFGKSCRSCTCTGSRRETST